MESAFDPDKDAANVVKHGVSLALAFDMDWDLALVREDRRFAYAEQRFIAIGPIHATVYVLAFTYRDEDIRPISLRKAEKAEVRLFRKQWE